VIQKRLALDFYEEGHEEIKTFDYRDGTPGLGLQGKAGKASHGPQIVGKRTIRDRAFGAIIMST
jgi:hypothetical protein